MIKRSSRAAFTLLLMAACHGAWAQGAGAQVNLLTPVGIRAVTMTWMDVDSNFRFGQTDIGAAGISTNSGILSYSYRFPISGRFAQFVLSASRVRISTLASVKPPGASSQIISRSVEGFGDPSFSLRVGLHGASALTRQQWPDRRREVQVYAHVGVYVPAGTYSKSRLLNPGFNRWAYEFALPVVIPLDRARRTTFLEITPKALYFMDNTDPFPLYQNLAQDPLYVVELQASHQLTPRFWASLGLQYQQGGATVTDGVRNASALDQWFGEVALGYRLGRHIAITATYGEIFGQANDARGQVLRGRVVFAF